MPPRRAMIKIAAGEERPNFEFERFLHICDVKIWRGKDGSMTLLLPLSANVQNTSCDIVGPADWAVGVFYTEQQFINRVGYYADRGMTL